MRVILPFRAFCLSFAVDLFLSVHHRRVPSHCPLLAAP